MATAVPGEHVRLAGTIAFPILLWQWPLPSATAHDCGPRRVYTAPRAMRQVQLSSCGRRARPVAKLLLVHRSWML
jgi:hypothetical protein